MRSAIRNTNSYFGRSRRYLAAMLSSCARQLGLRLTRAGFPDFDLESFFDAAPPDAAEIAEILRGFDSL